MTRLALAALLLAGCPSSPISQSELSVRVADATLDSWERVGLPAPRENCHIERFQVEFADERTFNGRCYPSTTKTAWACISWRWDDSKEQMYPTAVLNPEATSDAVEGLAVHELLHMLVFCSLDMPLPDIYDAAHTHPLVWERKGSPVYTAEEYARELLAD